MDTDLTEVDLNPLGQDWEFVPQNPEGILLKEQREMTGFSQNAVYKWKKLIN